MLTLSDFKYYNILIMHDLLITVITLALIPLQFETRNVFTELSASENYL